MTHGWCVCIFWVSLLPIFSAGKSHPQRNTDRHVFKGMYDSIHREHSGASVNYNKPPCQERASTRLFYKHLEFVFYCWGSENPYFYFFNFITRLICRCFDFLIILIEVVMVEVWEKKKKKRRGKRGHLIIYCGMNAYH